MKRPYEIEITALDSELLDAVIANNPQRVKELLVKGANPNCFEDKCELRPLHFASVYNATAVIFLLIKHGANVNALTADGHRAIDIARQLNHQKVVDLLISLSANLVSLHDC